MPWRPAITGLPGYQNGIGLWKGLVASGTVGNSWYALPALEISPVANASQMMPSVSSKRSLDSVHRLPNHACSIGETPRPTPKSRRPPVSWSAAHMSSMIWTGWCRGSSFTIGPRRIVFVICEAAPMKISWLGAMHRLEP